MYPVVQCMCGRALGPLWQAFRYMRREKYRKALGDDVIIDPVMLGISSDTNLELGPELDMLNIKHDCCRARMLSQVEFKEIY